MIARGIKARWMVTAEIIPGHIEEDLTQVWDYSATDFQQDTIGESRAIFDRMRKEANDYAAILQEPSRVNIVRTHFIWY